MPVLFALGSCCTTLLGGLTALRLRDYRHLVLATSDILPEAHAQHPSRLTLATTVLGVGVKWLVIGLAG